jgi:hypothetical protein
MAFAVLGRGRAPHSVSQCRFKWIEFRARYIQALIDHYTGKVLPHRCAHDSCLAMVHCKPFFAQNPGYLGG